MLCPSNERLAAALHALKPSADEADLADHLAQCKDCRDRLDKMAGVSSFLDARAKTQKSSLTSNRLVEVMGSLECRSADLGNGNTHDEKLEFLQPSDDPAAIGCFGPYKILKHIASGGMGIVLEAHDATLNRIVAIKILPPALAARSLARARFFREARAAAAVVHENVVPIYSVDESSGLPYLVMQFVQGKSLADRIRTNGPLPLEQILRIGVQTAAGLAAAHAQGLVHRDVKPGNILLENSVERVKLTDFGLALSADAAGLTQTGELAGTPEFMAPEQASGESVDHRTDLFSFGSVLYAMSAGHSPFQGASLVAVIRRVCDQIPPPLHEINPNIPRWLSDIIARLMEKAPADRFQSAQEVGALLEQYLARVQRGEFGGLPGAAKRSLQSSRVTTRAVAAFAAMSMVVALIFAFKTRRPENVLASVLPQANGPGPTNRPVPSAAITPLQKAFVVRGQADGTVGGFDTLEDALAAVSTGDIIELCWNGLRKIDPITLPAITLTMRAGHGFQPTWKASDSAPALSASSALALEGISFEMNMPSRAGRDLPAFHPRSPRAAPSGLALLSITNGPLRISHCAFDPKGMAGSERACITLTDVADCRLENSLLHAAVAKAIVWQKDSSSRETQVASSTPELTVSNCLAHAAEVIWIDLRNVPTARLNIARCTFHGPGMLYLSPSLVETKIEVEARQSVFHSASVILDARIPAGPDLREWLRWREHDNLYKQIRDQPFFARDSVPYGPTRVQQWNQLWNQTNGNARIALVTFASGVNDFGPGPGLFVANPRGFQITELEIIEGPPLTRDQWKNFGADTTNVGPGPAR